jgi:hypothetical protein
MSNFQPGPARLCLRDANCTDSCSRLASDRPKICRSNKLVNNFGWVGRSSTSYLFPRCCLSRLGVVFKHVKCPYFVTEFSVSICVGSRETGKYIDWLFVSGFVQDGRLGKLSEICLRNTYGLQHTRRVTAISFRRRMFEYCCLLNPASTRVIRITRVSSGVRVNSRDLHIRWSR